MHEDELPRLIYGCMRIAGSGISEAQGQRALRAAIDSGFRQFDLADIYGGGQCEELFGRTVSESPGLRDRLFVVSKCGIRRAGAPHPDAPQRYDFSRKYLVDSVEASLRRLSTDRLDALYLHRPDYLMRAEEVAAAFEDLHARGLVLRFGVSNFSASQVDLLRAASPYKLYANQVEINISHIEALDNGVLDQCQRLGMRPEAWCPLGGVAYTSWGSSLTGEDDARIAAELSRQSAIYGAEPTIIALAWLLRHPAGIYPIVGSTSPERIRKAHQALHIPYGRDDWYRLLEARRGAPVP